MNNTLFDVDLPKIICGLDEAGRGPLAGPVCAAAVILPDGFPINILDDSKALSEKKRNIAYEEIIRNSMWANDWTWENEIDELNILASSMLAMQRAFAVLVDKYKLNSNSNLYPQLAIADGNKKPDLPCNTAAIVKADAKFPCVMAASIIAKVSRDRLMERFDWLYPEYGYSKHKGYPTKAHRKICRDIGPSPIQRLTFNYDKE